MLYFAQYVLYSTRTGRRDGGVPGIGSGNEATRAIHRKLHIGSTGDELGLGSAARKEEGKRERENSHQTFLTLVEVKYSIKKEGSIQYSRHCASWDGLGVGRAGQVLRGIAHR